MLRVRCLMLAVLANAIMLAAIAANASARNFSTSSQTVRATFNAITFHDPSGIDASCKLTLEGSFHARTAAKVSYTLVGLITGAVVSPGGECTAGEATVLRETLPWHIRYSGFEGRLPDITQTRLLISGASFRVFDAPAGAICLFTSRETTREHIAGTFNRETGGVMTSMSIAGSITSNETCAFGIRIVAGLQGTSSTLTVLNASERIRLTLI